MERRLCSLKLHPGDISGAEKHCLPVIILPCGAKVLNCLVIIHLGIPGLGILVAHSQIIIAFCQIVLRLKILRVYRKEHGLSCSHPVALLHIEGSDLGMDI